MKENPFLQNTQAKLDASNPFSRSSSMASIPVNPFTPPGSQPGSQQKFNQMPPQGQPNLPQTNQFGVTATTQGGFSMGVKSGQNSQ